MTVHKDIFILDSVVHMLDNSHENVLTDVARSFIRSIEQHHLSQGNTEVAKRFGAGIRTGVDEALNYLFEESDTDMAMAQTVPFFGDWKEGIAPARLQYALKRAAPDRVLFCGGVDPLYLGLRGSLDEIERQVTEWGAVSFKFYKSHPSGLSWRADDRELVYPLYEKILELGINNVQFHCGIPFGQENVEDLRPNDIQGAARDFPDLTFIIHHLSQPYIDETLNIAARFENVWLALSTVVINEFPIAPWDVYHKLGKTLRRVSVDRLLWGSEAFVWPNIQSLIEAFMDLQIPEELQEKYGYPSISMDDKRRIFGLNFADLLEIDVASKVKELYPAT